jgi:RimJ/RimL family protein N-acetyltransferase
VSDEEATPRGTREIPRRVRIGAEDIALRAMTPNDRDAVLAFARSLPEHDLLFLRRDITAVSVLDAWVADLEWDELRTLLALRGEDVVGYTTVHREPMPWSSHVAEIRTLVAEPLRSRGLGRVLAQQAFALALEMGIEKLMAQMTPDQQGAIATAEGLGFRTEALLRNHVKDRKGRYHDLLLLSHDVGRQEAQLAAYGLRDPGACG